MKYLPLVDLIVNGLRDSQDREQGRRLLVEQVRGRWRIRYQAPTYRRPWEPGMNPDGWVVVDDLEDRDTRAALELPCLCEAVALAHFIKADAFKRLRPDLLHLLPVVVDEGCSHAPA